MSCSETIGVAEGHFTSSLWTANTCIRAPVRIHRPLKHGMMHINVVLRDIGECASTTSE